MHHSAAGIRGLRRLRCRLVVSRQMNGERGRAVGRCHYILRKTHVRHRYILYDVLDELLELLELDEFELLEDRLLEEAELTLDTLDELTLLDEDEELDELLLELELLDSSSSFRPRMETLTSTSPPLAVNFNRWLLASVTSNPASAT